MPLNHIIQIPYYSNTILFKYWFDRSSHKKIKEDSSLLARSFTKLREALFQNNKIYRYENYLWTKYYELYVIGTAKEDETITRKTIDDFICQELIPQDNPDGSSPQNPDKKKTPCENALPNNYNNCCSYVFQAFLHLALFLFQLIAQLVVIPLLTIQIFDAYAFMCLCC